MKFKLRTSLALMLVLCLLQGCAFRESGAAVPQQISSHAESSVDSASSVSTGSNINPSGKVQSDKLSAWTAYWDAQDDVLKEIKTLSGKLESLEYFAAYFDSGNAVFIPDETTQLREKVKQTYGNSVRWTSYLTFVNDKLLDGGGSSLKDTKLLYSLLEKPGTRKTHIQNILALTENGGYDGVEIDYEAIRKDMVLWGYFIEFITELSAETAQRGLLLRVVLEPGIPYESLVFPNGPDYVIMCYNLHGPGSEPGPKADDDFLLELVQKTSVLPGKRIFAVATGGFDWSGSEVSDLSRQEAHALAQQQNASEQRDEASQAIYFSYQQGNAQHQVWYADSVTINHWMNLLRNAGDFGVAVWRLGD